MFIFSISIALDNTQKKNSYTTHNITIVLKKKTEYGNKLTEYTNIIREKAKYTPNAHSCRLYTKCFVILFC